MGGRTVVEGDFGVLAWFDDDAARFVRENAFAARMELAIRSVMERNKVAMNSLAGSTIVILDKLRLSQGILRHGRRIGNKLDGGTVMDTRQIESGELRMWLGIGGPGQEGAFLLGDSCVSLTRSYLEKPLALH